MYKLLVRRRTIALPRRWPPPKSVLPSYYGIPDQKCEIHLHFRTRILAWHNETGKMRPRKGQWPRSTCVNERNLWDSSYWSPMLFFCLFPSYTISLNSFGFSSRIDNGATAAYREWAGLIKHFGIVTKETRHGEWKCCHCWGSCRSHIGRGIPRTDEFDVGQARHLWYTYRWETKISLGLLTQRLWLDIF